MDCKYCHKPIVADQPCYQVRYGYLEEDGETYLPEEDKGYYHEDCLPDSNLGKRLP